MNKIKIHLANLYNDRTKTIIPIARIKNVRITEYAGKIQLNAFVDELLNIKIGQEFNRLDVEDLDNKSKKSYTLSIAVVDNCDKDIIKIMAERLKI